jgi:hypothetical protein
LYLIAEHRQWFDRPSWAIAVIAAGLVALGVGFVLDQGGRGGGKTGKTGGTGGKGGKGGKGDQDY